MLPFCSTIVLFLGIVTALPGRNGTSLLQSTSKNVSYNHRAILIDGKPTMLITGAVHYPRSTPSMWPYLLRKTKEAGINAIDTYVFWDLHEPIEGHYDFSTGYANLPLFLQLAKQYDLYVNLRIGPYICAEWSFGGIPYWLLQKPGLQLRTINKPFQDAMETFIRKVIQVIDPYLAPHGGPIILLQMENEYGNVQSEFGLMGNEYIKWAADLARRLDVGVPWIMCQQDGVPYVLLTCNGFYCDQWIDDHYKNHPNQTAMFTELWSGWFQNWGSAKPERPVQDIAYSVARWVAKGGTYFSYYMWHGGTNFGRSAGSYKVTSYDYDAPLSEPGYPAGVKYTHLTALHNVLNEYADIIVSNDPMSQNLSSFVQIQIYGAIDASRRVAFLSNTDSVASHVITFENITIAIPEWTVVILSKDVNQSHWTIVFETSSINTEIPVQKPIQIGEISMPTNIQYYKDKVGEGDSRFESFTLNGPQDQLLYTLDKTDYLWYTLHNVTTSELFRDNSQNSQLFFEQAQDVLYVWIDQTYAGTLDALQNVGVDVPYQQNDPAIYNKSLIIPSNLIAQLNTSGQHSLHILSVANGLKNYGSSMQTVQKGVLGKVKLNDVDITNRRWVHHAGLHGDAVTKTWKRLEGPSDKSPLTWYRIVIPSDEIEKQIQKGKQMIPFGTGNDQNLFSFSLFTGSLGRGYVWANGQNLGRFWNAVSPNCNSTCSWNGTFWGEKCLTSCGGFSQSSLHLPAEYVLNNLMLTSVGMPALQLSNMSGDLELIILEEKGGLPRDVKISTFFA